jgi:lipoyl(octanoyl) transferase
MRDLIFTDWGVVEYEEAWNRQKALFNALIDAKIREVATDRKDPLDVEAPLSHQFILCQHPHVYTLGKSGKEANLLVSEAFLKSKGASLFHIERGGDITYHGPGQCVGYPILDLDDFSLSLRGYIALLEEGIIRTLDDFGITASREQGAIGVWLDADNPSKARKICAIGVRAGRGVTMHGFAMNVNTDLSFFNYIHPCGFVDKGVTSLARELGHEVSMDEVKDRLKVHFATLLSGRKKK